MTESVKGRESVPVKDGNRSKFACLSIHLIGSCTLGTIS